MDVVPSLDYSDDHHHRRHHHSHRDSRRKQSSRPTRPSSGLSGKTDAAISSPHKHRPSSRDYRQKERAHHNSERIKRHDDVDYAARRHRHRRHRPGRKSYSSDVTVAPRRGHKHRQRSHSSKSRDSHRDSRRDYSTSHRRSEQYPSSEELFKVTHSDTTTASSSSDKDKDVSIWDAQHGNRLEVFKHNGKEGYCQRESHKPLKYKVVVCSLVVTILLSAMLVVLSLEEGHKSKETTNTQNADNMSGTTNAPSKAPSPLSVQIRSPQPSTSTPTLPPTIVPTMETMTPTEEEVATYIPGKLTVRSNGLLLSEGLHSRIVATSGKPVTLTGLSNTSTSSEDFHQKPDGAAVFSWFETGGWVYVSNSEVEGKGKGGVGAIYFDKDGNVVDYQRLLDNTTKNCSGGPTPWGTWVSCEEVDGGKAYQVDPFGVHPPEPLSTLDTGFFESFAYDARNPQEPAFYVTEDKERGPLRRIIPSNPDWDDPWKILHGNGTLEYLVLEPNTENNNTSGSYYWTAEREPAKLNSKEYYKHSEGIDVHNNQLFFVSKVQKELFILNLDSKTYEVHSTVSGIFEGHPDQMKRLIHNGLLYFCEEGGKENGVHARDENGWFFSILESETLNDETTGLDFSPDGVHMYVSFQHNGLIFDVWREDGLPFHGRTLNVKYHEIQRG